MHQLSTIAPNYYNFFEGFVLGEISRNCSFENFEKQVKTPQFEKVDNNFATTQIEINDTQNGTKRVLHLLYQ